MAANYVLLERIELNASAASVTFANIPQSGYTDLKIVASTLNTAADSGMSMQFNSSSSSYSGREVFGFNGSAGSATYSTNPFLRTNYNGLTASTFSSQEIYIPNYTSANFKSFSVDSVMETNAANGVVTDLFAGLWSKSPAESITTITFTAAAGSFAQYSTFSLYGLAALGTTPTIAPKASGGNKIDYDGTYWIHTFNTSGTFTPQTGLTCDYLVVAGGGGGSHGGGGAGGLRTATGFSLSAQSYTVTVGAGGVGGIGTGTAATNGSNSVLSTITSSGGGYGGGQLNNSTAGNSGGSGGGASHSTGTSGAATTNYGAGNSGGYSPVEGYRGGEGREDPYFLGGGGGGSSAVGGNSSTSVGGTGGAGTTSSISGSSVTYAGGGGGSYNASGSAGGGSSATNSTGNGSAATINSGSGGGGANRTDTRFAGNGGSGIVIIRYLAA
jgi:hypothetical protein